MVLPSRADPSNEGDIEEMGRYDDRPVGDAIHLLAVADGHVDDYLTAVCHGEGGQADLTMAYLSARRATRVLGDLLSDRGWVSDIPGVP